MSLKPWYLVIVSIILFGTSVPYYSAFAVDDDFNIMDGEDYDEDTEEDTFADINNTDITYSDDDTNDVMNYESVSLNEEAGLVDVNGFDIAGIMLGMSFEDVYSLYHEHHTLYAPRKRNSLVYTIPQDWKYNLDYECRQSGIMQPKKLDKCIRGLARKRGLLYVSEIHLERVKTGETIDVYLTSNATDNVVYKIVYNNDADKIEGQHEKFADQRDKKILAFWKTVIKKYGAPNSGEDTWITSTNPYDPKMTAYFGSLELVDEGRRATDVSKASQQSREYFHAKPYAF